MALRGIRSGKSTRPPASGDPNVAGHLREALHRVLSGDLQGAELILAEAARVDSSSTDLYFALANVYRARGEIGRAIQIHQNLLLRKELPVALRSEALLGLALDFRAGGFLKRAAASFRELLETDPKSRLALEHIERLYVETGEWREALRIRRRIGSSDPRTPTVTAHLFTGLGRVEQREGRTSDAQRSFRRALAADRACAEVYLAFGDLRMQDGRPAKAIDLWQRALPLHPRIGLLVYPRLMEAYQCRQDLAGFAAVMRAQSDARPDDDEATLWWARAAIQMGELAPALGTLRDLLRRSPEYFPAYAELGRALLKQGEDAESAQAFAELLDHLPRAATFLHCRGCGASVTTLHWRCAQCGEWDSIG